jgi:hypothetical protein
LAVVQVLGTGCDPVPIHRHEGRPVWRTFQSRPTDKKTGGQVEEEVTSHGPLEAVQTQAVVEQAGDDCLAYPVGGLGARFDAVDVRAERLTTVAGGAGLFDRDLDDEAVPVGGVAEGSWVGALATTGRTAK